MTGFVYRYRVLIIVFSVIISVGGSLLIPSAKTDPDIRNYIPPTLVSRINTDSIEYQFGVQDIIMLLFHDSTVLERGTLERLTRVTDGLSQVAGVSNVMSLTNAVRIDGDDGFMIVEQALPFIPDSHKMVESLKPILMSNPLIMGSVLSDDFSATAVIAYLDRNINEEEILNSIDTLIARNPGAAEVLTGGLPYIRRAIMSDVRRDGIILVPMALLVMLMLLWISFREWRGVVIPFTVVVLSLGVAMGLAPLLGWKLSVVSLLVPVMMIAIANNYGIHLIARYQEIDHSDNQLTVKQIITRLVDSLKKPIVFTGLTTIAGILGLLTHSVIPARQVGILTALGVGYALLLSLFFIPAWLTYLPRPQKKNVPKNGAAPDGSAGYLNRTGIMVSRNPRTILLISMLITIGLGSGMIFLKVDSNQENFFPAGHPVKKASVLINESFGGSQTISVMVEGDILDPVNMKAIDEWCEAMKHEPGIGNVISIATVVREMSKALFDSAEIYYDVIPDTREALAQMVEIYNMSGDPGDFEQLVDMNYTKAHLLLRLSNPSPSNVRNIVSRASQLGSVVDGKVLTGGYAYIMEEFSGRIVRGQISSIIFALTVIFLLLIVIFRSLKLGLISTIPLVSSILILLGIMGWTGIALDPATALLSSVMIGIGVDYTIHFIWRFQGERVRGLTSGDAAAKAIATTGRGIVFNALSVMTGFSVLLFSGFTSIRFFGFLVVISIGVCLVAALMLVPALMIISPDSEEGTR